MAYPLVAGETAEEALRRIACSELTAGISEATSGHLPNDTAVHQMRKRCKRIRGLLRLVRSGFVEFSRHDADIRRTAGIQAVARDRESLLEAVDWLVQQKSFAVALQAMWRVLSSEMPDESKAAADEPSTLQAAKAAFRRLRESVQQWKVTDLANTVLDEGIRRVHRKARSAMREEKRTKQMEVFHRWRNFPNTTGATSDFWKESQNAAFANARSGFDH